jgi:hypothetical protein
VVSWLIKSDEHITLDGKGRSANHVQAVSIRDGVKHSMLVWHTQELDVGFLPVTFKLDGAASLAQHMRARNRIRLVAIEPDKQLRV